MFGFPIMHNMFDSDTLANACEKYKHTFPIQIIFSHHSNASATKYHIGQMDG